MIPRLLLVGGPGGSGSSTWAARLADSWAEQGHRVAVTAVDPVFGAHRLVTHEGASPVRHQPQLPAALQSAARSWRFDPFVAQELLHRLDGPAVLWQLPELLDRFDRVVVDAGATLGRLLLTAHALPWALDEAGPLHGGWLRATRPVTALAMGGAAIGKAGGEQLAAVTRRAEELSQVVISGETAVVVSSGAPAEKVRHAAAAVSLAQARLGATVGAACDERLDGAPHAPHLPHLPHWVDLPTGWDTDLADPDRDVEIRGGARGDEVLWRIPLPFNSFEEIDLEQSAARLVIGAHGHRRTFVLPSLLSRYVADRANLRHGILEVTFRPENA